jgi:hypothetical protein
MGYYKSTFYTGPNATDFSDTSLEARRERKRDVFVGQWPNLPECLVCGAKAPEGQEWIEGLCANCVKTSPTASHDAPGISWAEADARRQDRGESLGEPW